MTGRFGIRGLLRAWVLRWLAPPSPQRGPAPHLLPGGNVIPVDFSHPRTDGARFLCCPGCGHDEFAVVCRFNETGPYVTALVCTVCEPETEIGVWFGELQVGR